MGARERSMRELKQEIQWKKNTGRCAEIVSDPLYVSVRMTRLTPCIVGQCEHVGNMSFGAKE